MDNKNKTSPDKPSKAYDEAVKAEEEALKKLEEIEKEKKKWTKSLEDARKRKEYLSKTRQKKKSLSPRRKSTAMSMRSPIKQTGKINSQLVKTELNDDGELVQVFEASQNAQVVVTNVTSDIVMVEEKESSPAMPELPYCEGYDPISCVAPHQINTAIKNLSSAFNDLFFQPRLPDNNVKVPTKKTADSLTFFLFKLPDEARVRKCIANLGGTVVDCLEGATRVVFYPSGKRLSNEELFFLLTAAVGGRFMLPVSYIADSNDVKKFLDPIEYSSFEYYDLKHDLHNTTAAAIKMSNEIRQGYIKNGNPCFYLHNVLFAEPKGKYEDVILFLRICGAFVQPYYGIKDRENEWVSNFCITLIVNSGKVPLTDNLKCSPITSPESIRNILWRSFDRYV